MKKQLKDCTAIELITHFNLKSPFYMLSLSEKSAVLTNGKTTIVLPLDFELKMDEEKKPDDSPIVSVDLDDESIDPKQGA